MCCASEFDSDVLQFWKVNTNLRLRDCVDATFVQGTCKFAVLVYLELTLALEVCRASPSPKNAIKPADILACSFFKWEINERNF